MTTFKVIATLTWQIDSDSHADALAYAKSQLETILNCNPQGEDFEGFAIQVDLAKMKDRKKLIHLASYNPDDIFPDVTTEESKKDYIVEGKTYTVRMNSSRYHVFKANRCCVACGLEGTKFLLDINPGDQSPHFNLYAEENGRLVLMTKDHILAKSKGGGEELDNFATCCSICNNLKGDANLSFDQVGKLRRASDNPDKLPKRELQLVIEKMRKEMLQENKARLSQRKTEFCIDK